MGFFDKMKRAMGFAPADDELEPEGIDATVTPLRQRMSPDADDEREKQAVVDGGDVKSGSGQGRRDDVPAVAAALPPSPDASSIFDGVVGIFNESLPGFLRESVDADKQRRFLYAALDQSMKDYFDHLEKNVERRLHVRYQAESRKLQEQIEELRQKARKEEEGNTNAKNLQLSAERQKRALSERVHELEKQLASIEAENEQYILENKTMANKLRLASMTDRDVDSACQEILDREAGLKTREAEMKEKERRLEALSRETEQRLADLAAASASADNERIAEMEKEMTLLRDAVEQAKAKDELSRAMVNDLNTKAAEARKAAAEKEEQSAALRAELDSSKEQLALVNARLAKAQEDLKVVREVQEQVRRLEESQRTCDAELRRQKDELLEKDELIKAKDADLLTKNTTLRIKDETIRRLEDQTDSLRKSVETAQFEKTQTESALRSEIERLKAMKGVVAAPLESSLAVTAEVEIPAEPVADTGLDLTLDLPELVAPEVEAAAARKPRRGRPPKPRPVENVTEIEAVKKKEPKPEEDDSDLSLLDSTDWLIATPSVEPQKPKRQRKQKAEQPDDAFGYKEPVRQEPPDNPAQMLLW